MANYLCLVVGAEDFIRISQSFKASNRFVEITKPPLESALLEFHLKRRLIPRLEVSASNGVHIK